MQRNIKNLSELLDGAVEEKFHVELKKVLKNIFDPNTNPKAARNITISISFLPNEMRDACTLSCTVTSKLAQPEKVAKTVMLHVDDLGNVSASERVAQIPGQIDIYGEETPAPKIISFGNE